jgi:glyoxylase-like metal-dependent hydrolase (beta-lactamase superfamily II)
MTPEAAKDLKTTAEQLTGRKVNFIIDSHYHNDHIRGNQVFVPGAEIISTVWTRNEIPSSEKEEQEWERKNAGAYADREREKLKKATNAEKKEEIMWIGYYEGIQQSLAQLKITSPTITFSDSMWIYGSKRSIELVECKKGHTESDVVMILPEDGIAFMGDLLFVKRHPYLADGDAGSLQQHIHHFKESVLLNRYVPGHGPVGSKADMQAMENYLVDLQQLVRKGIDQHLPDSLIIQQPIPRAYQDWWYSRFYKANVQFLCSALRK